MLLLLSLLHAYARILVLVHDLRELSISDPFRPCFSLYLWNLKASWALLSYLASMRLRDYVHALFFSFGPSGRKMLGKRVSHSSLSLWCFEFMVALSLLCKSKICLCLLDWCLKCHAFPNLTLSCKNQLSHALFMFPLWKWYAKVLYASWGKHLWSQIAISRHFNGKCISHPTLPKLTCKVIF